MLLGLGAAVVLGGGDLITRFRRAVRTAEQRVSGRSIVVPTRFGNLEYAVAGAGRPLLMIHGTGGGFDQGLGFSQGLIGRGLRVVAPSRFGYLRSDFPGDPSSENQAEALVELLDHLQIERLTIAGGSAGALAAAQLALRHPDRCAGLILLVPAANVHGRDPVRWSALQERLVRALLASDFLYWSALRTMPKRLIGTLLATDPRLLDEVSEGERRRAYRILEGILPIHARARGMLNDARLAGQPARMDFGALRVPTLVLSVEDDRFGTAATARDIAAAARGAKLRIYPSGGHIWLGHDEEVAMEIAQFVGEVGG